MRATLRIRVLGETVCGGGGGDAFGLGPCDDIQKSVVDLGGLVHGSIPALTLNLTGYGDYPAGVYGVVGRIEDSGLGESLCVVGLLELVVGGPGYDWRLDLGNGVVV